MTRRMLMAAVALAVAGALFAPAARAANARGSVVTWCDRYNHQCIDLYQAKQVSGQPIGTWPRDTKDSAEWWYWEQIGWVHNGSSCADSYPFDCGLGLNRKFAGDMVVTITFAENSTWMHGLSDATYAYGRLHTYTGSGVRYVMDGATVISVPASNHWNEEEDLCALGNSLPGGFAEDGILPNSRWGSYCQWDRALL